jgi:phosphotransferase system enzyme I (PtsI)
MERMLAGIAVSPGIWIGTAHRLASLSGLTRVQGNPEAEASALADAIAVSASSLADIAAAQTGEAADMLGFQVAMLEDPALAEPAFAAIRAGNPADDAWKAALAEEIAGYESSDDEYFRARSADLADIRDRVLAKLYGNETGATIPAGVIVIAVDLKPSEFLSANWSGGGGIALEKGSPSSHVAMLARAKSIPMVAGLGDLGETASGEMIIDGAAGTLTIMPEAGTVASARLHSAAMVSAARAAQARIAEPAMTVDGTPVKVMVNVASLADLAGLDPAHIDGIGLTRTEFLVEDSLLDEERQYQAYAGLVAWAKGKPVTVRTFDAGGDKPVPGYTLEGEANPFLGMRGVRLSLKQPEVFKVQLRAILRAAALGPVKVMLPMVTSPDDLEQSRAMLKSCASELATGGVVHAMPDLGIMVEVPAVAMAPELFDAAFFSIGSNDLTQYATAAGRDSSDAARWADVTHPGVLAMIARTASFGAKAEREVSLCGDAGGDPAIIRHLLHAGIRTVSVAPGLVASTKAAISNVDLSLEVAA